jgi:hypothetical protein
MMPVTFMPVIKPQWLALHEGGIAQLDAADIPDLGKVGAALELVDDRLVPGYVERCAPPEIVAADQVALQRDFEAGVADADDVLQREVKEVLDGTGRDRRASSVSFL